MTGTTGKVIFYGGTIHMDSSVSKKEIDKKSIMFLFDLYKQKIPKQIKPTFDHSNRES